MQTSALVAVATNGDAIIINGSARMGFFVPSVARCDKISSLSMHKFTRACCPGRTKREERTAMAACLDDRWTPPAAVIWFLANENEILTVCVFVFGA